MQALLDRFASALSARAPARAARAGGAGAAGLHRGGDRRLPGAGPRRAGDQRRRHVLVADRRRRAPGRAHPRPAVRRAAATTRKLAELYSQALVGMVALVGQWWLDIRKPDKDEVAAHLVNLAYNGLAHLDPQPGLASPTRPARGLSARSADQARAGHRAVHGPHGAEDARHRPARRPAGRRPARRRPARPRWARSRSPAPPAAPASVGGTQRAAELGAQAERRRLQVVGQRRRPARRPGRSAARRSPARPRRAPSPSGTRPAARSRSSSP